VSRCAAIVAPEHPLVDELVAGLGVDVLRIPPGRLDAPVADLSDETLVWMHLVPAGAGAGELDEAALLLRSAERATEAASEVRLTFLALLPSRGLFAGRAGLACVMARGALEALMRTRIGAWSARGDRLLGVVYAGFEGHRLDGQRTPEEVRLRTPIGRHAGAGELADAIRYLGSPLAAYLTGTLVHVDGGWNAYSWIYPARTI
jgi:NAD(P)-dependent dehydrogenase (short-subunit alcohol dehydrogenase family)